jgi:hypothetical protein
MENKLIPSGYNHFLKEIKQRIRTAQYEALKSVNKELILLYWDIGGKIVENQKKHGWGEGDSGNPRQRFANGIPWRYRVLCGQPLAYA